MQNFPTANQLGGRAVGSIFFTGFGAIWLLLALYARQQLSVVTVASIFVAPAEQLQGTSAMGTGIILWLSAFLTLALAFQAARQPADLLTR